MIPAEAKRQEYRERQHGEDASGANHPEDARPILSRRRVVVVAEQQQLIGLRTDPAFRGFHERQPQIARSVLDAEQVARRSTIRPPTVRPSRPVMPTSSAG